MVIADMIHSCSNANVAEAAVYCVVVDFAERIARRSAQERGECGSVRFDRHAGFRPSRQQ